MNDYTTDYTPDLSVEEFYLSAEMFQHDNVKHVLSGNFAQKITIDDSNKQQFEFLAPLSFKNIDNVDYKTIKNLRSYDLYYNDLGLLYGDNINADFGKITNVRNPTLSSDCATKAYLGKIAKKNKYSNITFSSLMMKDIVDGKLKAIFIINGKIRLI